MLNMLSGIFGEMFWPMCECNLLALYERYEKKTRTMQIQPSEVFYKKRGS